MKDLVRSLGSQLFDDLVGLGASDDQAKAACFAFGQRAAMLGPWGDMRKLAKDVVERYKVGDVDVPGEDLARRGGKRVEADS